MKHYKLGLLVFLGLAFFVTGCNKKASNEANVNAGFDTLATTEELAQLPQANTANQQAGIEVLPIEPAPVTQQSVGTLGQDLTQSPSPLSSSMTLTREQQIQTALKNAGLYNGPVDGKIGAGSKRAITAFQTAHNLKADGKVGPKTWTALEPFFNGTASSSATAEAGVSTTSALE